MKKYMLLMLLLLTSILTLSACTQREEEKIQAYLKDKSQNFYDFLVVDFTVGELNIEFKMLPHSETLNNDDLEFDVAVETKALLEAIKSYSKEHLDVVKDVNIYFITRESNKTVAEINANNGTLLENNWLEVSNQEFLQIVDGYKFYGASD
ncbi:hypothetical protein CSV71_10485 [Sporosarcina sp. P21c]|uniref:hypothetical protein n=1 Tax=unclassified Sporosarcina TaxID=2647733 RepID=UPI000C1678C3|nr:MULTISPECIES: hypothetical protein [unclassified Sporosarcina]PIC67614.1 hypothetical protein CSV78_06830 [Sporosarcina sp. P16a]PIC89340.1 hypothetical protein CSV71_10485 [Sporosarcina sp. P21c]PIC93065.1 hypothetical protein CSV70_07580 [Sporosarcina sp. P25]